MAKLPAVWALAGSALVLAGCSFAPAYAPPPVDTPAAFKESGPMTPAAPTDAAVRRDWWAVYGDTELDGI